MSEKAIGYFERASLMQPDEVKWRLMISSCYRRSGNYHKAMETYKATHIKFPENVECLRFLVKLSTDMGLKGWMLDGLNSYIQYCGIAQLFVSYRVTMLV